MCPAPVRIHPTAWIDPQARLAGDVIVGPQVVVEGPVTLGAGSILRARAHLIGPLDAGPRNDFGIGCVVGERAQHRTLADAPGSVVIGSGNVFREYVTIHRSTVDGSATRIGNDNFLMANAHIAHDCVVGDRCVLANSALVGGHSVMEDGVFMSGNTGVHQHCRVGRLAILSAGSSTTRDVPPFAIHEGRDTLVGVNVVGLRRAGMTRQHIDAIRRAYRLLLYSGLAAPAALERIRRELAGVDAVAELVHFFSMAKRGVCLTRARRQNDSNGTNRCEEIAEPAGHDWHT
jgi:UDP-N-acetylglucosamine acyltransferase